MMVVMMMMMMILFLLLLAMVMRKIYDCCRRTYCITNSTISSSVFQIIVLRGNNCTVRNITFYGV